MTSQSPGRSGRASRTGRSRPSCGPRSGAATGAPGERLPSHPGDRRDVRRREADRPAHHRPAADRRAADHQARLGHLRPRHPAQLNRLSRGRYGSQRGYHADLAARYRQQLIYVGRAPRRPRSPTRSGFPTGPICLSGGTSCVPRRHRSRSARPGCGRPTRGTSLERLEAFGRPLYQEVEEVTGRRYVTATDQITRPAAHPRGGRAAADPAGHAGAAPAARRVRRRHRPIEVARDLARAR